MQKPHLRIGWKSRPVLFAAVALWLALTITAGAVLALAGSALGRNDRAEIEVVVYDAETGRPIYATNQRLIDSFNATNPSTSLYSPYKPGYPDPLVVPVEADKLDGALVKSVVPLLSGRKAGDVVRSDVQAPPHEWEDEVKIARVRGPFPMEHDFPRDAFEKKFGTARLGQIFPDLRLTNATMEIVSINASTIRYRNLMSDGQVVYFDRLEWPAIVDVDDSGGSFTLTITPEAGYVNRYRCRDRIFTDLQAGHSYKVVGMDESTLTLAHANYSFPHVIGRTFVSEARIVKVHKFAEAHSELIALAPWIRLGGG